MDDEVTRILPEYLAGGERPTVRDLLTHTSGIPNYTESPEFDRLADRRVPREEIMKLFAGRYDFPPGREWAYSNSNYFLLGLIVERVSGMSYSDYLSDRIFTPLGMRDTSYCPDEPSGRHQARGYQLEPRDTPHLAEPLNMQHAFAAGALCSTVEDLVRWSEAFHGHRFLSAGSYELMTTPVTLASGTTYPYGFGLELDDSTGVPTISHGGGINGFLSWLAYLPDQRVTVVVLVNSTSGAGESLIREVVWATRPECATKAAEPHRGAPGPGDEAVPNGGFETGDFEGWTVQNQMGSLGDWFVHSGATSPLSCTGLGPVPEGRNGATTEPCGRFGPAPGVARVNPSAPRGASGRCREAPDGPGTHILYRDIALAPGMTHELSFFVYYRNESGRFAPAETLDFAGGPNQQYRVDVLNPTANPFSVEPGDVLATLFRTKPGDPPALRPTLQIFDLSSFAGSTIRLRFAEVDNLSMFQAGVDAVAITSRP